jgi:hypothetical protein
MDDISLSSPPRASRNPSYPDACLLIASAEPLESRDMEDNCLILVHLQQIPELIPQAWIPLSDNPQHMFTMT